MLPIYFLLWIDSQFLRRAVSFPGETHRKICPQIYLSVICSFLFIIIQLEGYRNVFHIIFIILY
jgi:hypothetical protein